MCKDALVNMADSNHFLHLASLRNIYIYIQVGWRHAAADCSGSSQTQRGVSAASPRR